MKIRIPRKLKKRYKKMGIWRSYLHAKKSAEWQDILTLAMG